MRGCGKHRGATAVALSALLVALILTQSTASAGTASLQDHLTQTRQRLDTADRRQGVLSSTIERQRSRARKLRLSVAHLSSRDAILSTELAETEAQLSGARQRRSEAEAELERIRERLAGSTQDLRRFLVDIYRSGEPDVLTVILESNGFDELLSRSEYANRLAEYRSQVIARVRAQRARMRETAERLREAEAEIENARASIIDRRERLAAIQRSLAAKRRSLGGVLERERRALASIGDQRSRLEQVESRLQRRIEAQLAASATPPAITGPAAPEGGDSSVSDAGLIWPVQGPLTSPFGPRWGRLHAGIDIAAPGGTPIRAAASGSVEIAAPNGGYGNYTCINHAGGLSTCYAHQSAFATSAGASVEQGEVIGYVGNTGNSFGDHLHFEVRTSGVPQDPLGYL